jgi:hypothetical protein
VPIAQVAPPEAADRARGIAAHLGDHAVLRGAFGLADVHGDLPLKVALPQTAARWPKLQGSDEPDTPR